jgi:hypothetical protein
MGYEKTPRLHQSAHLVAVMAALATLLDWFPAQFLHIEPVNFRGFGLFCVSCSMILSLLGRQDEATQSVSVLHPELQRLLSVTCFTPVLEMPQVLRDGQVVRPPTSIVPLSKQAAQVTA